MESGKRRKRPWEEDSPMDSQLKRQDLSARAAATGLRTPLLHQPTYNTSDGQNLSPRRLTPLPTPSSGVSTGPWTSTSIHVHSQTQDTDDSRPRSESLFDVFHHFPPRSLHSDSSRMRSAAKESEQDKSPQRIGSDAQPPRLGSEPTPRAAGEVICCPPACQGQACLHARALMRKIAAELILLDSGVRSISQDHHRSLNDQPDPEEVGVTESLKWALSLVQWINLYLHDHIDPPPPHIPERNLPTMRRIQQPSEQQERQSPPVRPYASAHHGYTGLAHPALISDDTRRQQYGCEAPPPSNSPHHTISSSSGSMFMPPQSPLQTPQPSRSTMLPSPSSMNFPNLPQLPSISPPSTAIQNSAQTVHMQDLQHQISVKTLAFQTLQREYDSLLQKLERQRTKCATLEKKFEVSDVEINSLTDEKEKLHAQVASLESQVEELQQSRDEARRQLVANGAQYMRIMEMANRLQAQGADDKKQWEAEKAGLQQRIKVLEEAMVTGGQRSTSATESILHANPVSSETMQVQSPQTASSSSTETINVLRVEIHRLRDRTRSLEAALQSMRQESVSIQAAARKVVEAGFKIETTTRGVLES